MPDNQRVTTTMLLAAFAAWLTDDIDFDLTTQYGVPAEEVTGWLYDCADRFMHDLSTGGVFLLAADTAPALTLQQRFDRSAPAAASDGGPHV
jgi:hypothetical protein